jgi:hypothetical protein
MLAAREEGAAPSTDKIPPHEALVTPAKDREREYIDKVPPPPILERPGEAAPSPNARWIEGYWDWDKTPRDFAWVTGTWRVPPAGRFWVNGYWQRHEKGWFRVPGFWSERIAARTGGAGEGGPRDWRREGPPTGRPAETIRPAPGPDYFYIAGEYLPDASGVVWRPGFWSRSQPGWEWMPARWVRQSTGWAFRDGSWARIAVTPTPGNTVVSTPATTGTPAADPGVTSLAPLGAPPPSSATNGPFAGAGSVNGPAPGPDGRTGAQPLTEETVFKTGGIRDPDQGTTALIDSTAPNGENPSSTSPAPGNGNANPAATPATGSSAAKPGQAAATKPASRGYQQPSPYYRYPTQPYYAPGAALRSRFYGAVSRFLPD